MSGQSDGSDFFREKKGVHIQLRKQTHSGFRQALFEKGVSMQAAFEEFAYLVANKDQRACRIVEELRQKKIRGEIESYKNKNASVDELDHDTLYDLIGNKETMNE